MNLNKNFFNLKDSYLFADIAKKVNAFVSANKNMSVIRLGIGDVTRPLAPAIVSAMEEACKEMGGEHTFRGYGPEQGYNFLQEVISEYYAKKGAVLQQDEIFISCGAKSDVANILDLFSSDNTVLIPDPVYPVYVDTNIMDGRKIVYLEGNESNGFLPMPCHEHKADIIYLCSPNNPTGAVYTKNQLKQWVQYARDQDAIILFDAAYEIFVQDQNLPTSIFQIEGANECAIEFGSFSKTAGFTGTRCAYTVVSKKLKRDGVLLNDLWRRRQTTKFNGVPYIIQRGAEAVFTDEGWTQIKESISYYKENAKILSNTLKSLDIWHVGGKNSPYIWLKCPNNMRSWDFFDYLLNEAGVVGTPGVGFGVGGEWFFRLSSFGSRENVYEASKRIEEAVIGITV